MAAVVLILTGLDAMLDAREPVGVAIEGCTAFGESLPSPPVMMVVAVGPRVIGFLESGIHQVYPG